MTAIFYPDCIAASKNCLWLLEACSPHNGKISYRDGAIATDAEFGFKYREHQRDFRYRLIRLNPSAQIGTTQYVANDVAWERWQPRQEDSPHELVVSDEGWCVIRTHGFKPEVIFLSPNGAEVLRVLVVDPETRADENAEMPMTPVWTATRMQGSTAGMFWAENSWPFFAQLDDIRYFVWRTYWGDRMIVDLTSGALLEEDDDRREKLGSMLNSIERETVEQYLRDWSIRVDDARRWATRRGEDETQESVDPLTASFRASFRRIKAATLLAGIHRCHQCVPHLRLWEDWDLPNYSTSCVAAASRLDVQVQFLRPILHHTFKLLGAEPDHFPAYDFLARQGEPHRLSLPRVVLTETLVRDGVDMDKSAEDVLALIGSPDHIRKHSRPVGKGLYEWSEEWEYDVPEVDGWVTWRITWEEHRQASRMISKQHVGPFANLAEQRAREILSY